MFDDSFFGFGARTERKTLRTEPLTVMVHPLPAQGQPDGFAQLVGEFELSGSLSETSVPAGDSATLTLRLHGNGTMRGMQTIDLPPLPNVKIYDDKPVLEADQSTERAGATLIVKKAIVPMEPGALTIPAVTVAYFNPIEKKYTTAQAGPFALTVLPARQAETLQATVPGRPKRCRRLCLPRVLLPKRMSRFWGRTYCRSIPALTLLRVYPLRA